MVMSSRGCQEECAMDATGRLTKPHGQGIQQIGSGFPDIVAGTKTFDNQILLLYSYSTY